MLTSVLDQKKKRKRELLLSAAFELFVEKGASSTAIDDIVRKAGVAKGTFYLYFRDRNEILNHLIAEKSAIVLREADEAARKRGPSSANEEILLVVDEVVERFRRDPKLLALIYKNLSWGLFAKALGVGGSGRGEVELVERLSGGRPAKDFAKVVSMVLELVSSVSYSAIILEEPAGIEEMKPLLIESVRRLIA